MLKVIRKLSRRILPHVRTQLDVEIYAGLKDFRRSVLDRHVTFPCDVLEIGAFTAPTVDATEANVKFLDFFTTDELIEKVQKSGGDPSQVVDVHYVCRDDNYVEVVKDTFDLVVANHVFEHIDHSIRWLQMIRTMLRDDGLLFLVLPDKKYSFDKFRPDTPVSHILFEYLAPDQDASTIHNFETALYYDLEYIGKINDPREKLNIARLKQAISESHPGVHRHVFQAETFESRVMRPLLFTGLIDFDLLEVKACRQFGEFAVVLRAGAHDRQVSADGVFLPATDSVRS